MPEQLSQHFTLEELTASEVALRHGISNKPNDTEKDNLKFLASQLEIVRAFLGQPMHINSAFRSLPVNTLVGSQPTSAHVKGLAADFVCPGFGTPEEIVKALVKSAPLKWDQLILEFGRWVHIGFAEAGKKNRGQNLVIDAHGTRIYP